jgi:hypothetical protein
VDVYRSVPSGTLLAIRGIAVDNEGSRFVHLLFSWARGGYMWAYDCLIELELRHVVQQHVFVALMVCLGVGRDGSVMQELKISNSSSRTSRC